MQSFNRAQRWVKQKEQNEDRGSDPMLMSVVQAKV